MTSRPLVTVVMCSYNAGEYLRPALESVQAQTYDNLEILIIDDGSTDGSIESISGSNDHRIRIIRQPNRGKPAALNTALGALKGEFYAINDADDLSDPRRIEMQVACMIKHPSTAAVFTGYELIIDSDKFAPLAREKDETECASDIARFSMPSHDPTAMYRVDTLKHLLYDESLPIVEGYDYILRVGEQFPMRVLGECLYSYRIHNTSITKRDPQKRELLVQEAIRRAHIRRGLPTVATGRDDPAPRQKYSQRVIDNNIAAHFMESVCNQRAKGCRLGAVRTGVACVRLHPHDPHYWKALAYSVMPLRAVNWIRRRS